jgi:hypothetical protein
MLGSCRHVRAPAGENLAITLLERYQAAFKELCCVGADDPVQGSSICEVLPRQHKKRK